MTRASGLCFVVLSVLPLWAAAEEVPLRAVIDQQIAKGWERDKLIPAAACDDATFLRRVSLDLCGVIPTYEETIAFLGDAATDKREKLIDKLLANPKFAQHQADVWDLALFTRHPTGYDVERRPGFQRWLREQFAQNTPYNIWVRTLLKAEGNTVDEGAPTFLVMYRSRPEDANETITQMFLGVQLQCARCHDHPYEKWTQLDFYGMAAFLSRLQVVSVGKKDDLTKYSVAEKSTGDILFTGPASQQEAGKKGEPVKPKFLLGDALQEPSLPEGFKEVKLEDNKTPPAPQFSRKDQLAEWVTRADNPFFSRAVANRIWAQFLGRGLVHPVDNMSPSNVPSHPELLDALTTQLVAHNFDLKWYIRELLLSRTYQLSSSGATGEPFPVGFERGRVRPLSAEELTDSWKVASGYEQVPKSDSEKKQAANRFHPLTRDYVVKFFGTPNSGAGDFQGGLHEHLYLNNGELDRLTSPGKGSLHEIVSRSDPSVEERIDRLFLTVLSRRPTADEKAKLAEWINAEKMPAERWRDAIWSLMTCSEFRFAY